MSNSVGRNIPDLGFVSAFTELRRMTYSFRDKYLAKFDEYYEHLNFEIDEDEIARLARDDMQGYVDAISAQHNAIFSLQTLKEDLLKRTQDEYLPKNSNIPGRWQTSYTPEQRHFLHISERIDALGMVVEEMSDTFSDIFDEIGDGSLLHQDTFDPASETCDMLLRALDSFSSDFPPLFSAEDRNLIMATVANSSQNRDF